MKLVSIESNAATRARQEFHKFRSNLDLRQQDVDRFIRDYEPSDSGEETAVFWLDFTDFEYQRFVSFGQVLKKVPLGSIVRMTLRAKPDFSTNGLDDFLLADDLLALREEKKRIFRDEFAKTVHHPYDDPLVGENEFAKTVQMMHFRAAASALGSKKSDRDFLHVHSVRYDDNTQMLSVTGVVHSKDDQDARFSKDAIKRKLCDVPGVDFDWGDPHYINIPDLTYKERLKLEAALPIGVGHDAAQVLADQIGYKIHDSTRMNEEMLIQYARYYREYPSFVRGMG